jgi:hypothetical protein
MIETIYHRKNNRNDSIYIQQHIFFLYIHLTNGFANLDPHKNMWV